MKLQSYVAGSWYEGEGSGQILFNAVNGDAIAEINSKGIDFKEVIKYAHNIGNKNLRKYTFHDRARMLKSLAQFLLANKEKYYKLSYATGATKTDSWIDIEGGIATLFTYASKGRRELPNENFYIDGNVEPLSKNGTFIGRHICVPLEGAAIHINAFNFPIWGMLEKLSPSILAGLPVIVKPASLTGYLTELMAHDIVDSGILPEGAFQLISGSAGDLLNHLTCQDVVTFTGSASTGKKLKRSDSVLDNAVRFNMEADSLNFSMLGINSAPGTPEFDLFIKEVVREMTVKAGQKCTAIRRVIVPEAMIDDVKNAIKEKLSKIKIGDPQSEGVRMGPLAGREQVDEVRQRVEEISANSTKLMEWNDFSITDGDYEKGAFFSPTLILCERPFEATEPHSIEAFGPVSTLLPYKTTEEAIELAKLGKGSLVGSVFSGEDSFMREVVFGTSTYHGRLVLINSESAGESTGHGSPMPHMVHGGPGRAGGGEEMGGIRGVMHYMQRTALQGSPTTLSNVYKEWTKGAKKQEDVVHPFKKYYEELQIGDTLSTHGRTVTEADIVNFAGISGDFFYAHMDATQLEGTIFERRVAHGYFVISAAAGLFVDPKRGPVLANYGLDELRFIKPVYPGDTIRVNLTVKNKEKKEDRENEAPQGVVKWDVEVLNQNNEQVAQATILTLVARKS
jgi:oxepin-CoA hydrolase/3-oxo-5,6-dehydrosuberyl-CoA semialdehyde dehydrogenase